MKIGGVGVVDPGETSLFQKGLNGAGGDPKHQPLAADTAHTTHTFNLAVLRGILQDRWDQVVEYDRTAGSRMLDDKGQRAVHSLRRQIRRDALPDEKSLETLVVAALEEALRQRLRVEIHRDERHMLRNMAEDLPHFVKLNRLGCRMIDFKDAARPA